MGSPITARWMLPGLRHVEDHDRQRVLHAQRDRRGVHHLQSLAQELGIAQLAEAPCAGVELGVGVVHAVDLGRLEDHLGADLGGAQAGGGVGAEEGIAGAGGEDDDAALFEVAHGAPADVGLGDLADLDRRHHARRHALALERVLQGEGIDHRRQHAHVVASGAVGARGRSADAAKDVAAADHQRELEAEPADVADLGGDRLQDGDVDPVRHFAHQGFAAQLEQDTLVAQVAGCRAAGRAHLVPRIHAPLSSRSTARPTGSARSVGQRRFLPASPPRPR